jgi:hypothetical protein
MLLRPNNAVERTTHSARFVVLRSSVPVGRRSPRALDAKETS